MVVSRTRMSVLLGSILVLALSSPAGLAADGWRIVDTTGEVTSGGTGYMPASLNKQDVLPADAWVETKANGRAVLARGMESIIVGPNSRVQLPSEEVNGNTQVLQTMGSALYRIGKQSRPHFQVDTPYLAAVVKGTQFTVTVGEDNASVTVTEGRVEVATPDQSDVEFVTPGFTATVSHDHGGSVVVEKTDGATSPAPGPEPAGKSASNEHSDSASAPGSIEITTIVGEVDLDVKEVSGGLAFSEFKSAMAESVSEGGAASKIKEEKDASDSSEGHGVSEEHGSNSVVASTDEGSTGKGEGLENENGVGIGNGNGAGAPPVLDTVADIAPDLAGAGNGNAGGNGNGNAGGIGNGNAGGNGNGNAGGNGNGNGHAQ